MITFIEDKSRDNIYNESINKTSEVGCEVLQAAGEDATRRCKNRKERMNKRNSKGHSG